jgi:hypothetical protein
VKGLLKLRIGGVEPALYIYVEAVVPCAQSRCLDVAGGADIQPRVETLYADVGEIQRSERAHPVHLGIVTSGAFERDAHKTAGVLTTCGALRLLACGRCLLRRAGCIPFTSPSADRSPVLGSFTHTAQCRNPMVDRSGRDGQAGSVFCESGCQLAQDRQVGVQPNPIQSTGAEREHRPLVRQAPELSPA